MVPGGFRRDTVEIVAAGHPRGPIALTQGGVEDQSDAAGECLGDGIVGALGELGAVGVGDLEESCGCVEAEVAGGCGGEECEEEEEL